MIPYQIDFKEVLFEGDTYTYFPLFLWTLLFIIGKSTLTLAIVIFIMNLFAIFCEVRGKLSKEENK